MELNKEEATKILLNLYSMVLHKFNESASRIINFLIITNGLGIITIVTYLYTARKPLEGYILFSFSIFSIGYLLAAMSLGGNYLLCKKELINFDGICKEPNKSDEKIKDIENTYTRFAKWVEWAGYASFACAFFGVIVSVIHFL